MLSLKFAAFASALVATVSALPLQKRMSGTATFYQAGLGNCGWTNSGSDMIVALPTSMYAGGSHCGKKLTVTNQKTGKTQQATVADSCPTCGSSQDLDMSWGLFSALGGTENEGVFPISWSFGGSSGSSSNNNNNDDKKSSSSSSSSHSATPTSTSSSSSHSATSTASTASATKSTSTSAQPTSTGYSQPKDTVSGTPAFWAEVTDYCGLDSKPEYPVAIAPSKLYGNADLANACGKAVSLKNPANGKTVEGTVVSYLPGGEENAIALGTAFRALSDNYDAPAVESVQWGFANKKN